MKLTKDDFLFITKIIELNKKRIFIEDFSNLKPSQVQYKFKKINFLLKITNRKIIKRRFGNFYVNNFDELKTLIQDFEFSALNKYQRMNIIIKTLLIKNHIGISSLENTFSQSRTAVKKDLKSLRIILEKYSIKLIYKKKLGLFLAGNENNIHLFFLSYFLENYDFFHENIYKNIFNLMDLNILKIKTYSLETLKVLNIILIIQYHRTKNNDFIIDSKKEIFTNKNIFNL